MPPSSTYVRIVHGFGAREGCPGPVRAKRMAEELEGAGSSIAADVASGSAVASSGGGEGSGVWGCPPRDPVASVATTGSGAGARGVESRRNSVAKTRLTRMAAAHAD